MKFVLAFLLIAVILAVEPIYSARVCVINTRTCTSTINACGRYGRSNLCTRFANRCALDSASCSSTVAYTAVGINNCSNIALNRRGTCRGTTSTVNSLLTSSRGSNVQPIIINTGK